MRVLNPDSGSSIIIMLGWDATALIPLRKTPLTVLRGLVDGDNVNIGLRELKQWQDKTEANCQPACVWKRLSGVAWLH